MRYYSIRITDPKTGELLQPILNGTGFSRVPNDPNQATWSSLNAGAMASTIGGTNPAALRIEMDMPVTMFHTPDAGSNPFVRVYGIWIGQLGEAAKLQGMNIAIYGGMAKGLPLANDQQSGLLAMGQIFTSYGAWQGQEVYLAMYIAPQSSPSANQTTGNPSGLSTAPVPVTNQKPASIVFSMQPGQHLMDAVKATLVTPFPQYSIQGAVSPNLIWTGAPEIGYFNKMSQFADYVHKLSLSIIGGPTPDPTKYVGVMMSQKGNVITIQDGTTQTAPLPLAFQDLVGQPQWLDVASFMANFVMRGDLSVGMFVTMPPGPSALSANVGPNFSALNNGVNSFTANSPLFSASIQDMSTQKNTSLFTGTYLITKLRHVGDSRDPNGESWITQAVMIRVPPVASPVPALPLVVGPNPGISFYTPN